MGSSKPDYEKALRKIQQQLTEINQKIDTLLENAVWQRVATSLGPSIDQLNISYTLFEDMIHGMDTSNEQHLLNDFMAKESDVLDAITDIFHKLTNGNTALSNKDLTKFVADSSDDNYRLIEDILTGIVYLIPLGISMSMFQFAQRDGVGSGQLLQEQQRWDRRFDASERVIAETKNRIQGSLSQKVAQHTRKVLAEIKAGDIGRDDNAFKAATNAIHAGLDEYLSFGRFLVVGYTKTKGFEDHTYIGSYVFSEFHYGNNENNFIVYYENDEKTTTAIIRDPNANAWPSKFADQVNYADATNSGNAGALCDELWGLRNAGSITANTQRAMGVIRNRRRTGPHVINHTGSLNLSRIHYKNIQGKYWDTLMSTAHSVV
ncbi:MULTISPECIES: hypothetical protein [Pseudoalteromonas]|uniref:Uncharacterized protein n=1 Tax=Pseudoalteromonas amylolytica TaxID=1859457 RepID=A0A1S1MP19_9GAMM|nr:MULTISPECIES: hypothetical protein [Pseudoalteromonas]OHU85148.1 hypothetical protein BFC16_20980 [Pseudoalteromonas sp. JW3]OHU89901.1 hypothetical protein BET10_13995 [Pseudoalteromonas amylolytica]